MAVANDVTTYEDVLVVLATAAVAVPLLQKVRLNPILAYLLIGVVLGPHMLGGLLPYDPIFRWFTVYEYEKLAPVGELGVTFLLFIIGLELAPRRLWTMRRLVFGLGPLQVLISATVIGSFAAYLGQTTAASIVIGFALALSSTAIVIELLSSQNRMSLGTGRASFAILLLQDLAVIPLLILVPILGQQSEEAVVSGLLTAFAQSLAGVGIVVGAGYMVLRPLFRLVASTGSNDLFVAAVLLVAVGSGVLTAAAGMSMALGAFVAGLLLAETEYRKAIEATIEPFKSLLLGVFFFTVGAGLDVGAVLQSPLAVLAAVAGLILAKGVITGALVRSFGFERVVAGRTAAVIGPAGEFAFILLGIAATVGVLEQSVSSFLVVVASLSMFLIPVLDNIAKLAFPVPTATMSAALMAKPAADDELVAIVIGHGRVGTLVSSMLDVHSINHVITEKRPNIVSDARSEGRPVFYGDALNTSFLIHCGLLRARAVIITIHDWSATEDIVRMIRALSPTITIIARARDADHARFLYGIGVTDAVPETIEASLQLSEAALVDLGVPTGPVIASIHEKRDEFRSALQSAAGKAGRKDSHGVRAKTTPPIES
jgi:CPA2 family monovalent cation:H+ antiporter-2